MKRPAYNEAPFARGPANSAGYVEALDTICVATWQGQQAPDREWLVPGLIPMRQVTLITGDGGLGKTLLALQLQASAALGRPWLGVECRRVKSLGLYCEDEADELHRRFSDITGAYQADLGDLEDVDVVARVGEDNSLAVFDSRDTSGGGDVSPLYHAILKQAKTTGAQLVVLDSLYDFFSGNENNRPQVHRFGAILRCLAQAINGAVIVCGHPSVAGMASGSGLSGSTAWNAVVRSRLYLTRPPANDGECEDPDARLLTTKKANYGPSSGAIRLRWNDGIFEPEGGGLDFVGRLAQGARQRAAQAAFLACMDAAIRQGRALSDSSNSPRYAPKVFAGMPEGKGFRKTELVDAMQVLFSEGRIMVSTIKGPDRHPIRTLVRTPQ